MIVLLDDFCRRFMSAFRLGACDKRLRIWCHPMADPSVTLRVYICELKLKRLEGRKEGSARRKHLYRSLIFKAHFF